MKTLMKYGNGRILGRLRRKIGKGMKEKKKESEARKKRRNVKYTCHISRLSIGRVNEFGIYEPGMEPQPGREGLCYVFIPP